ncbi:very-long-chain aldehyde decarbonylase GL1-10-like [Wolffia australiana]
MRHSIPSTSNQLPPRRFGVMQELAHTPAWYSLRLGFHFLKQWYGAYNNLMLLQFMGIRTSLPLPSLWEACSQLLVYFLVDDYVNYWLHRMLHSKWLYENIHRAHHEFTAPIGFAAPYAHWAEVLIVGSPSLIGPALAPGHMVTLWAWIILRHLEAIETHIGYKFPLTPTKYIPFYGGAEFHDYHHNVGGQSRSNFASIFTYCDYIYRKNKGYQYHIAYIQKSKSS